MSAQQSWAEVYFAVAFATFTIASVYTSVSALSPEPADIIWAHGRRILRFAGEAAVRDTYSMHQTTE